MYALKSKRFVRFGYWLVVSLLATIALILVSSVSGSTDQSEQMSTHAFASTQVGGLLTSFDQEGNVVIRMDGASHPAGPLTPADYQRIYDAANPLLDAARQFRLCNLQMQQVTDQAGQTCNEDVDIQTRLTSYYTDFNNRELLDRFCQDSQVLEDGTCPAGDIGQGFHNQLLTSRKHFVTLYLAEPASLSLPDHESTTARELGLEGLLATTRELAYAHMIFASEYAIDAFDYRFTIEGLAGSSACAQALEEYQANAFVFDPQKPYDYFGDADCVIQKELALLTESRRHLEYALNVMTSAYSEDIAWPRNKIIGELFQQTEIEIFSVAIENYAQIIDAIATRHRQLGDDNAAHILYREGYQELYLLSLPLLERAKQLYVTSTDADTQTLLNSNALAVRASINQLQAELQAIDAGVNIFGYTNEYVPVQSYHHMRDTTDELLAWAETANDEAIRTNREWEIQQTELTAEISNARNQYEAQLADLCGMVDENNDQKDDTHWEDCLGRAGSLMEQNWIERVTIELQVDLADQRIDNAVQSIVDVQNRYAETVYVRNATNQQIGIVENAIAMKRAYQTFNRTSNTVSDETFESSTTTKQKVTKPGLFGTVKEVADGAKTAPYVGAAIGAFFGNPQAGASAGQEVQKVAGVLFGSVEESTVDIIFYKKA